MADSIPCNCSMPHCTSTTPILFGGCDPDTDACAWAWVTSDLRTHTVGIARSDNRKLKGAEVVISVISNLCSITCPQSMIHSYAIERQKIYPKGAHATKDPNKILLLSQVAGACVHKAMSTSHTTKILMPEPSEWKGQIDKLAHHWRILKAAGIADEFIGEGGGKDGYCYLKDYVGIQGSMLLNQGDWKHVVDAIGLAQYAAKKWKQEQDKQRFMQPL